MALSKMYELLEITKGNPGAMALFNLIAKVTLLMHTRVQTIERLMAIRL